MQRKPSGQFSGAARSSHRHSGDYRGRASFGANNDNTAGVTQVPAAFQNGQARSNGIMAGPQQFDMARSPPSTASKSMDLVHLEMLKTDLGRVLPRHQTCPLQILQTRRLSSWSGVSLPPLDRCHNRDGSLQIFRKGWSLPR